MPTSSVFVNHYYAIFDFGKASCLLHQSESRSSSLCHDGVGTEEFYLLVVTYNLEQVISNQCI